MFKDMEETFKEQVFSLVTTIDTKNAINITPEQNTPKQTLITSHSEPSELTGPAKDGVNKKDPEVGRNDPCPCGSGKKYKKCHGA
jgi:preprotein translocase subunit SecA